LIKPVQLESMTFSKIIAIVLLACSCISCKEKVKDASKGIVLGIPVNEEGDNSHVFKTTKRYENQMDLESLQNAGDSIGIRIWQLPSLYPYKRMIQLRHIDSNWEGIAYLFSIGNIGLNMNNEPQYDVGEFSFSAIYPKSGWSRFMDSLHLLGIRTLPAMDSIPDIEDNVLDGIHYCVEVTTKNSHRFYDYHSPSLFSEHEDARNMTSIIDFINGEFDLDSLEKNYWTSGNMTDD
jgi:hypothetical protein